MGAYSNNDLFDSMGMQYYFTSYGDVYAGVGFEVPGFPNDLAIIQNSHLREFSTLSEVERTKGRIEKSGWLVPKKAIEKTIPYRLSHLDNRNSKPVYTLGEFKRKDMFIFGAGASAFCCPQADIDAFRQDNLCPPLGNELFAKRFRDIYRQYGGVKQWINELAALDVNVEEFLEEEWREVLNGNTMVMSRHINIQFYLQDVLMKVSQRVCDEYFDSNLYSRLARKLQLAQGHDPNRRFGLVSFNQDTIMEHFFCRQFKYNLESLDDFVNINEAPFSIFKPHGSWNWGWRFPRKMNNLQSALFERNLNYCQLYFKELGTEADMVDWFSFGYETIFHDHNIGRLTINKWKLELMKDTDMVDSYFPALLIPYRDKDELTFPHNHYHALTSYLGEIETLYIVGWKGNERIFNKLLTQNLKNLKRVIIADPNKDVVEQNLAPVIKNFKPTVMYYSSFEDFISGHSFVEAVPN